MNNYFYFSNYELDLINSGLLIMMTKKAKKSMELTEEKREHDYEEVSLELFELCLKIKSLSNEYTNLSSHELDLIKSGLIILADCTYRQGLEKQDEALYYESFDLQFKEVWEKIHNNESTQVH
ncbi:MULTISPECIES: hypothetical protein [Psychrobacter]|uniref:Uncharacterized protein n=1 Tax=Psychrobacter urativorans TaxID=45610 RepID=A0A0M3V9L9_9GAMM|nr:MULTISPECIES: hypothetical protein [Psychrobacter]ALF60897.1 hypothetical protein AOC03_11945 [Psychrobacter urativorans]ALF60909.1 hypothetical protein AOC03_12005 [Psychrobacter urativorans]QJS05098.1 hypothetical protein [Psychrobacter sp.]